MRNIRGEFLLADIGGTNARFALLKFGELSMIKSVPVAQHSGIQDALRQLLGLRAGSHSLAGAVIAVAGPVENNRCALTNSQWVVDGAELRDALGLPEVRVINDFEALAWSIPSLSTNDLFAIGPRQGVRSAPCAVLGPGTGLGLAFLLNSPGGFTVMSTEGGHVTLPSTSPRETAVIDHLRVQFGHVSAERALSGQGIENLYRAIRAIDGVDASDRSATEITQAAVAGTCLVSTAALDMFCAMLGTMAGNVALTLGARGGVYIAGGIVPHMLDYLANSKFRVQFEAKGRFRTYLSVIPVNVIVHPDPAFIGLKALVKQQVGLESD
jgi:glucokinase